MDLLATFQSLESNGVGRIVRESLWMFPVIECFHLLFLALLGGLVFVIDLRLLGFGLASVTGADLEARLRPLLKWAVFGLIATGVPMFVSEAVKCYYSPPFWYKIAMLVVATLFTFTVHAKVATASESRAKLTAALSMLLWFGVAFAGRWIAFY